MPKLKKTPDRYENLKRLILGSMKVQNIYLEDLARATGLCRQSVSIRLKCPDKLTLSDLRAISAALGIPFDEIRQAIPGR